MLSLVCDGAAGSHAIATLRLDPYDDLCGSDLSLPAAGTSFFRFGVGLPATYRLGHAADYAVNANGCSYGAVAALGSMKYQIVAATQAFQSRLAVVPTTVLFHGKAAPSGAPATLASEHA